METDDWRSYLETIYKRRTSAAKKLLQQTVDVSATTFTRWMTGENTPTSAHIFHLLQALPSEESANLRAFMEKDPRINPLLPKDIVPEKEQKQALPEGPAESIPIRVYEQAFRLEREAHEPFWQLCSYILREALLQLETYPEHSGVEITVARCMPLRQGKVRSLRAYAGCGTSPWRRDLHMKDFFWGANSLAGAVVTRRHSLMIPDLSLDPLFNTTAIEHAKSCAAAPILRQGEIAGALVVSAKNTNFFIPDHVILLEKYADLIRIALKEYFPTSCIDLAFMPSLKVQEGNNIPSRTATEYERAMREGMPFRELVQIEDRVRLALEEELIGRTLLSDEEVRA